jgi:hypothetical protein
MGKAKQKHGEGVRIETRLTDDVALDERGTLARDALELMVLITDSLKGRKLDVVITALGNLLHEALKHVSDEGRQDVVDALLQKGNPHER